MWRSKTSSSSRASVLRRLSSLSPSKTTRTNKATRRRPLHISSSQDCCQYFSSSIQNNDTNYFPASLPRSYRNNSQEMLRQFSSTTSSSSADLKSARATLKRLSKILKSLQPIEPTLEIQKLSSLDVEQRRKLLDETRAFFDALRNGVLEGTLNPSGKHGKELSQIAEYVLHAYSQAYTETPVLQECLQVLKVAEKEWNLDISHNGYDSVIAVAHREQQWKDGAALFLRRIDPEGGFNPIEISVDNPLGLYAIAKIASMNAMNAAEAIFDAVFQLSMVSPNDQDKYVLAACTALGHVNEWESALDFLVNDDQAKQFGMTLVAGVMQTCILSREFSVAVDLFAEKVGLQPGMADEWQWGGGRDPMVPLCRDLAMQAMIGTPGMSSIALELFRQTQEEEVSISFEALRGVFGACELDSDWEASVAMLFTILGCCTKQGWAIPKRTFSISQWHWEAVPLETKMLSKDWYHEIGGLLGSVMRTCNKESRFGVAMLCHRIVDLEFSSYLGYALTDFDFGMNQRDFDKTLEPLLTRVGSSDEILAATISSLCGLGCIDNARALHELYKSSMPNFDSRDLSRPITLFPMETPIISEIDDESLVIKRSWESAYKHLHRLSAALHLIKSRKLSVSENEKYLLLSALSKMMQACNEAHQPGAGLLMRQLVEEHVAFQPGQVAGIDSVVAESISAFTLAGQHDEAIKLVNILLESNEMELSNWRLSIQSFVSNWQSLGLDASAVDFLHSHHENSFNPSVYSSVARSSLITDRGKEVEELYHRAVAGGSLSEDMALQMMQSLLLSKKENLLLNLRAIISDAAAFAGESSTEWMESRYWRLKEVLGFKTARLLLWWNDPRTCHLDELQLCFEEMDKRRHLGIEPRIETVLSILEKAAEFQESFIPDDKVGIPRVPRTSAAWATAVDAVVDVESKRLIYYPVFNERVVKAYKNLGYDSKCFHFVGSALRKGFPINEDTLQVAEKSLKEADNLLLNGEKSFSDDIGMISWVLR